MASGHTAHDHGVGIVADSRHLLLVLSESGRVQQAFVIQLVDVSQAVPDVILIGNTGEGVVLEHEQVFVVVAERVQQEEPRIGSPSAVGAGQRDFVRYAVAVGIVVFKGGQQFFELFCGFGQFHAQLVHPSGVQPQFVAGCAVAHAGAVGGRNTVDVSIGGGHVGFPGGMLFPAFFNGDAVGVDQIVQGDKDLLFRAVFYQVSVAEAGRHDHAGIVACVQKQVQLLGVGVFSGNSHVQVDVGQFLHGLGDFVGLQIGDVSRLPDEHIQVVRFVHNGVFSRIGDGNARGRGVTCFAGRYFGRGGRSIIGGGAGASAAVAVAANQHRAGHDGGEEHA